MAWNPIRARKERWTQPWPATTTALTTVLDEGRFHLACVLAPPGGGHAPHSSAHRAEAEIRTTINRAGSGGVGFYGP